MNETTFKMITDAAGKTDWWTIESRGYSDAFENGPFAFRATPVRSTFQKMTLSLRARWCLTMHRQSHVQGEVGFVYEVRCLKCGLEYAIYPRV